MFQTIVHCDWSKHHAKRLMSVAESRDQTYLINATSHVGETQTLLKRARSGLKEDQKLLFGFDFPIGLPQAYGDRLQIHSFMELLPKLGQKGTVWEHFFDVCQTKEEISLHRPFYPDKPGGRKRDHLLQSLGLNHADDLFRACENSRPKASPLFWVLGAKQVGKAAITGWMEVLQPLANQSQVGFFPFGGDLKTLCQQHQTVVAESYPALSYQMIGLPRSGWSKRNQNDRRSFAGTILSWIRSRRIELTTESLEEIHDGFGQDADGEDRFDAFMGVLAMIEVTTGRINASPVLTKLQSLLEGWMLGKL